VGWMTIPFLFLLCRFRVSVIAPPMFPFLLVFPPPPLHLARRSGEAPQVSHIAQRKWKPVAEVGGDQIHLVPMIAKVGMARVPRVPQTGCVYGTVDDKVLARRVVHGHEAVSRQLVAPGY